MRLRLIRHATLLLDAAGRRLLVDPQLDPEGARDPVPGTPHPRRSPLVGLPEPPEVVTGGLDALLVTHLHTDHLDATALRLLERDVPIACQPPDEDALRGHGFTAVTPIADAAEVAGLRLARTEGRHGTGAIGAAMAPVCGFVISAPGEPALYVAGDTIWCPEVAAALDDHRPAVVVVNAGAARFDEGDPITMTVADVLAVARHAPSAHVVAVHFEAVSHCTETRADLRERLRETGLAARVSVPEDGAEVPLP